MKNCTNCQKPLDLGVRFCIYCGAPQVANPVQVVNNYGQGSDKPSVWLSKVTVPQVLGGIGVISVLVAFGFLWRLALTEAWFTSPIKFSIGVLGGLLLFLTGSSLKRFNSLSTLLVTGGLLVWQFSLFAGFRFFGWYDSLVGLGTLAVFGVFSTEYALKKQNEFFSLIPFLFSSLLLLISFDSLNSPVGILSMAGFVFVNLFVIVYGSVLSKKQIGYNVASISSFLLWGIITGASFSTPGTIDFVYGTAFASIVTLLISGTWKSIESSNNSVKNVSHGYGGAVSLLWLCSLLISLDPNVNIWVFSGISGLAFALTLWIYFKFFDKVQIYYSRVLLAASALMLFGPVILLDNLKAATIGLLLVAYAAGAIGKIRSRVQGAWIAIVTGVVTYFAYGNTFGTWKFHLDFLIVFAVFALLETVLRMYGEIFKQRDAESGVRVINAFVFYALITSLISNLDLRSGLTATAVQTLWLLAFAVVLLLLNKLRKSKALRVMSLLFMGIALIKVYTYDILELTLLLKVLVFSTLGALLIVLAIFWEKSSEKIKEIIKD